MDNTAPWPYRSRLKHTAAVDVRIFDRTGVVVAAALAALCTTGFLLLPSAVALHVAGLCLVALVPVTQDVTRGVR